jgi:hypothetical protein
MRLYYKAIAIGFLFCVCFTYLAAISLHRGGPVLPSTQICEFAFILLLLLVIAINPLLRLLKLRPLSTKELVIVGTMAIVPAGVTGFGFTAEFIPFLGSLHNPKWSANYKTNIIANTRPELFVRFDDPSGFETYNDGLRVRQRDSFPILIPKDGRLSEYFPDLLDYFFRGNPKNRSFWGDVPWAAWLGPLALWCLFFVIIIVLFYALNELVFRQWYENEKLVFPHTELICSMIGVGEAEGTIPSIYRNKGFWIGFSISFLIMLYNGLTSANLIPGMSPIDLTGRMTPYIQGTWLEAATFSFTIFFAVIGLAFLLPGEISFSIWFFFFFLNLQRLVAVHSGYVPSSAAFGTDWLSVSTFISNQGGGAMIVFATACMWKVRHNLIAWIYRIVWPNGKGRVTAAEIREQTWPSIIFGVSSIALIGFFLWAKTSAGTALLVYFMILVITITCMRLVSECGLLSFQLFFGPYHLIKNFGLLRFPSLFNVPSLASSIPLFGAVFLDLKTFMAPAFSTCRALVEKVQAEKRNFVVSLILSFAVSIVLSIIVTLALVYDLGVNSMNGWFFDSFPNNNLFPTINNYADNFDTFQKVSWEQVGWTSFGGLMMGGILLARRVLFWFPHPIGLILFINPIAHRWWFSFFIAWLCKTFAVKYCKPKTYQSAKLFFMGLFIGELVVVAIAAIVMLTLGKNMGVTMNR